MMHKWILILTIIIFVLTSNISNFLFFGINPFIFISSPVKSDSVVEIWRYINQKDSQEVYNL